jgi:anti-sigma regulatory factor (Ser/Thr protein kinase)
MEPNAPHPPSPPAASPQAADPRAPVVARHTVRTLQEARELANRLAEAYPEPEGVVIGLTELLVNAVEHGCLGIVYQEKADLLEQGAYDAEIERRLALPALAGRVVTVTLRRDADTIATWIEDPGDGFDWLPYIDYDPERALDANGHGIAIARGMSFDEVTYHGRGNVVVAAVRLSGDRTAAPPSDPGAPGSAA